MGVDVAVVAAAAVAAATESLSASIPARLIRVEPDGFLSVPLIVEAMLPLWVPRELRGLDPRAGLKAKEFIPALEALRAAYVPRPIGPSALLVDPVKLHVKAGYPLPTEAVVVVAPKLPVVVAVDIKFERRFSKLISTSPHCTPPDPPTPDPPLEQPSPQRVLSLRKKTRAAFRMAWMLNGPPKVSLICG